MQTLDSNYTAGKKLTFEELPQVVATLVDEIRELKSILLSSQNISKEPEYQWFNVEELRAYLPDHPARQTIYGWVCQRAIPCHKKGKKLQFLKSAIDEWLKAGKRKTKEELYAEALEYVNSKKRKLL